MTEKLIKLLFAEKGIQVRMREKTQCRSALVFPAPSLRALQIAFLACSLMAGERRAAGGRGQSCIIGLLQQLSSQVSDPTEEMFHSTELRPLKCVSIQFPRPDNQSSQRYKSFIAAFCDNFPRSQIRHEVIPIQTRSI